MEGSGFWQAHWFDSAAVTAMRAWRGVEAQHVVATLKLTDNAEEQELLETLLESSKPPLPAACAGKHYLLTTPFRYSPAYASRFRPAYSRGQWYGAQSVYAVCAELAYWRQRLLLDSEDSRSRMLITQHSLFQAQLHGKALDLTREPWARSRALWTHPTDYRATQALAASAQQQAVQWLRYESARAAGEHCAVAFDPACLAETSSPLDSTLQTWVCKTTQGSVTFQRGTQRFFWSF